MLLDDCVLVVFCVGRFWWRSEGERCAFVVQYSSEVKEHEEVNLGKPGPVCSFVCCFVCS